MGLRRVPLKGEAQGNSIVLEWDQFPQTLTTPDGFLLYPQRRIYYWIPREGFSSEQDFQETAKLLAARTHNRVVN